MNPAPPSTAPQDAGPKAADPPGRGLERRLRDAVLALKTASPRGHLAPVLLAGTPGSADEQVACEFRPLPTDDLDHDSRVEVAVALGNRALLAVDEPVLWVTRSGDLEAAPCDLGWHAAGCEAWLQLGLPVSFVVLTRHGWRHHPSGAERTWRRLRRRS